LPRAQTSRTSRSATRRLLLRDARAVNLQLTNRCGGVIGAVHGVLTLTNTTWPACVQLGARLLRSSEGGGAATVTGREVRVLPATWNGRLRHQQTGTATAGAELHRATSGTVTFNAAMTTSNLQRPDDPGRPRRAQRDGQPDGLQPGGQRHARGTVRPPCSPSRGRAHRAVRVAQRDGRLSPRRARPSTVKRTG